MSAERAYCTACGSRIKWNPRRDRYECSDFETPPPGIDWRDALKDDGDKEGA